MGKDSYSKKRPEDWARLILLNWVLIGMVMFYSILVGGVIGGVWVMGLGLGLDGFRLFPVPSPAAQVMLTGSIALVFLLTFRALQYNCAAGNYGIIRSQTARRQLIRLGCKAFCALILLAVTVGLLG